MIKCPECGEMVERELICASCGCCMECCECEIEMEDDEAVLA